MQSKAKTVDDYLKEIPTHRLESLSKIRQLCIYELKGYVESMRYGMPSYEKIILLKWRLPVRKILSRFIS